MNTFAEYLKANADYLIPNIILPIVVGSFGAWFGAHVAIWKFRSQKWWERRLDAYLDILDSLLAIKSFSVEMLASLKEENTDRAEEEFEEYKKSATRSSYNLLKKADLGTLLLSKQAIAALNQFAAKFSQIVCNDPNKCFTEVIEHINICRKSVIEAAKKDLSLPN